MNLGIEIKRGRKQNDNYGATNEHSDGSRCPSVCLSASLFPPTVTGYSDGRITESAQSQQQEWGPEFVQSFRTKIQAAEEIRSYDPLAENQIGHQKCQSG